jgi:transposase-like protein
MRCHGEKRTRKEEQAIEALLTAPTIEAAAQKSGVAPVTLYRWLRDPSFRTHYRKARSAVLESAIAGLQGMAKEATETLGRNLHAEQASVQISAAKLVLDFAIRGQELMDLKEQTERLEREESGGSDSFPDRGLSVEEIGRKFVAGEYADPPKE